jgi:hypothetical protein
MSGKVRNIWLLNFLLIKIKKSGFVVSGNSIFAHQFETEVICPEF